MQSGHLGFNPSRHLGFNPSRHFGSAAILLMNNSPNPSYNLTKLLTLSGKVFLPEAAILVTLAREAGLNPKPPSWI